MKKRGLIVFVLSLLVLILISILISGCQENQDVPKGMITLLYVSESSNMPVPVDLPESFLEYKEQAEEQYGKEAAKGDVYIGNFLADKTISGKNSYRGVYGPTGKSSSAPSYKLNSITLKIKPLALYIARGEYQGATALIEDGRTRVKLREISFLKYATNRGVLGEHTESFSDADTLDGKTITKTIMFDNVEVPRSFIIYFTFEVGEGGTQEEITVPASIQSFNPKIVTWQPFPGEQVLPEPSDTEGIIFGYVYDETNRLPITNNIVVADGWDNGVRAKTNSNGYYEIHVPVGFDTNNNPRTQAYYLNFDGCDVVEEGKCIRQGWTIKELFYYQNNVTDFDYGTNRVNYPSPVNYSFVEGNNGNLYWVKEWITGTLGNKERAYHTFFMKPAPPGAYLRANKPNAKRNEKIKFEGFSIATYQQISSWTINFGDGAQQNGYGARATAEHSYTNPGEYEAEIRFTAADNKVSPWYKKKISVEIAKPAVYIDSIEPSILYLNFNEEHEIIPGSVKIKAHATHPLGNSITAWELTAPNLINGIGDHFELDKMFNSTGTYEIKARFKDDSEVWSDWVTKSIKVQELTFQKPVAEAGIELSHHPYICKGGGLYIITNSTKLFFFGGAKAGSNPVVKYSWDFNGDGKFDSESSSGGSKSYVYDKPGIYTARFVVKDSVGNTDTVQINVRVLNTYIEFKIEPSNIVNKGDTIKMRYTLYNKDTLDLEIKEDVLLWYFDPGEGFRISNYEENPVPLKGNVKAGQNKVLWSATETAEHTGKWRGDAIVDTQCGEVKTSLIKTIVGQPEEIATGTVSFSSDKGSYVLGETAIFNVKTDISDAEFCDWFYRISGSNDWIIVPDRAYLSGGKASFKQLVGQDDYYLKDIGVYEAFALCSNSKVQLGESSKIKFNINRPLYLLSTNKAKYKQVEVYGGSDPIIFSADTGISNLHCFVNLLNKQYPERGWRETCSIITDGNGDGTCKTRSNWIMGLGMHSAKLQCDNGGESSEIDIEIVSCPPGSEC